MTKTTQTIRFNFYTSTGGTFVVYASDGSDHWYDCGYAAIGDVINGLSRGVFPTITVDADPCDSVTVMDDDLVDSFLCGFLPHALPLAVFVGYEK